MILELCHFYRNDSALITLVTMFPSCTVLGLLQVIGRKQTIYNGNITSGVHTGYTLGNTLTDIVEMGCLTTNHTTQDDNSVISVVKCHLVSAIDQLERAGNGLDMDILWQGAMLL